MKSRVLTKHLKYHLLAFVTVVAWAVSFINTRVLLDAGVLPIELYVYRFIISYVCLLACCRFRVHIAPWRDELRMAVLGAMGGSAYFIAQNVALQHTLVSNVAILVDTNPLFTILLAAVFLREERLTWPKVVGSVVAFAGVALITFRGGFVWGDGLLGDLLALLGAFVWAIYTVVLKRINNRYSTMVITRKTFFYGIVTAIPFMLWEGHPTPLSTWLRPDVLGHLLYLSLVCSMAAFFAWGIVTKGVGPIAANNYLYLGPAISMLVAAIAFGERVGALGLLACVLILAGVIVVERQHLEPNLKCTENK
ncbi:MAG: DMT family transporter [Muribaculaceae bacterium]|nr:DMT family transporter [Muribaculaceae bacterium]